MKYLLVLLISFTFVLPQETFAQKKKHKLTIKISNIRNKQGNIVIGFFRDQESFDAELSAKEVVLDKRDVRNGSISWTGYVSEDVWGISMLDDEDEDGEMNFNFFGIPREGYGFSNYIHSGLTRPRFTDFSFNLNRDLTVNAKMQYM